MSNLDNFNNLYADLAESSYNGRPLSFTNKSLRPDQLKRLDSGKSVKFDFSQNATDPSGNLTLAGQNLPNNGVVYLQPDLPAQVQLPANPTASGTGQPIIKNIDAMSDYSTGYNSYLVTDCSHILKNMGLSEKERTLEISA